MTEGMPVQYALTEDILTGVTSCLNELALALADPFERRDMDTFAEKVRRATGVEAVSVFMPAEDNPNVLVPVGGVGYRMSYRQHTYLVNQPALTPYVYKSRQPINLSLAALRSSDSVPFSGSCQDYIETGHFYNIVATPILYGYSADTAKCLGVLKLENQGKDPNIPLSPESFALARILAEVIAIAHEQRRVADLWNQAEKAWLHRGHRNLASYRETAADLARKLLDAEGVALYRRIVRSDGSEILRHDVGFRKECSHPDYELSASPAQCRSIISQTARRVINREWGAAELAGLTVDPFVCECAEELSGNPPRSLLIFSVHNGKELLGALAVVNKVGDSTSFDVLDEEACGAFARRHIVPYLEAVRKSATNSVTHHGFDKLREKFGPYQPLKGTQLLRKVLEIEDFRKAERMTAHDCGAYLGLKRENYLGKVKLAKKTFSRPDAPVTP
jgi:hypothetical protein